MAETFLVKSALPVKPDGGSEVALWEVADEHPNGEVYIAGERPVEVANTAGVQTALRDGKIVRAEEEKPAEAAKPGK